MAQILTFANVMLIFGILVNFFGCLWYYTAVREGIEHSWLTAVGEEPVPLPACLGLRSCSYRLMPNTGKPRHDLVLATTSAKCKRCRRLCSAYYCILSVCPDNCPPSEKEDPDLCGNAGGADLSAADAVTQYFAAIYFTTTTITTTGYGDISAHSVVEQIIAMLIMFVGAIFFGFLISAMLDLVTVCVLLAAALHCMPCLGERHTPCPHNKCPGISGCPCNLSSRLSQGSSSAPSCGVACPIPKTVTVSHCHTQGQSQFADLG